MHLSLLHLDIRSPDVLRDLRDPQFLHARIMGAFPSVLDPEQKARAYFAVLYRLEEDRRLGRPMVYVQSAMTPDWSTLPVRYLMETGMPNPAVKDVGSAYGGLAAGRVLRFRLRANPTRTIDTKSGPDGAHRNGRRVPLQGVDRQIEWLQRRGEQFGFSLMRASVVASGSAELLRSSSTGRTFQGVLFEGVLSVRDPDLFREGLQRGIGPGKAYGFGLLSVAPA